MCCRRCARIFVSLRSTATAKHGVRRLPTAEAGMQQSLWPRRSGASSPTLQGRLLQLLRVVHLQAKAAPQTMRGIGSAWRHY